MNFTTFDVIEKFDNFNLVKNSNSNISSFVTIQEGVINFVNFALFHTQEG